MKDDIHITAAETSKKLSCDTQVYTKHKYLFICAYKNVKSFLHEINFLKDI